MGLFNIATNILGNIMLEQLGLSDQDEGSERFMDGEIPEIGQLQAIQDLKSTPGSIITILGRPKTGKSVVARRIAEEIGLPVYAVSPKEKPPGWITPISFKDTETKPGPYSTLILDDAIEYASSAEYGDISLNMINKTVFTARHERKIHIIWCAQTSGLLEKYALTGEIIVFKPPSLLFEDLERPMVRKLQKRIWKEVWAGKPDWWLKKHCYLMTHDWRGVVRINLPQGIINATT